MRIGIDLGGTKIEAIALDDNGKECFRKRISSPQGSYQNTLDALINLINEVETTKQLASFSMRISRFNESSRSCLRG